MKKIKDPDSHKVVVTDYEDVKLKPKGNDDNNTPSFKNGP